MPRTAHLLAAYGVAAAAPFMPDVDAMLMMSPDFRSFICGTTRLVMSTSPKTLVSNSVFIFSTSRAPISAR